MAANYAHRRSSGPDLRSTSPSAKFNRHSSAHTHLPLHFSSSSHTRINQQNRASRPFRFSLDRTHSNNVSIYMATRLEKPAAAPNKTCMCSPTTHPGSFRCSLHKSSGAGTKPRTTSYGSSGKLNIRRSAMKNSLVRIGTVEGDLVNRILAALIRPSSHQQRRRGDFQPCPSRLSAMTKA